METTHCKDCQRPIAMPATICAKCRDRRKWKQNVARWEAFKKGLTK